MGGPQLVVDSIDLHLASSTAHPDLLLHQAERNRVVGIVEVDVAVPTDLDLFPDCHIVGCAWQRVQCLLLRFETVQRLLFGRAVDAMTGSGVDPLQHVLVGLRDGRWLAAAQKVPLDIVNAALFNLPLVPGRPGAAGSDEEIVVLGTFAIGLLRLRFVPAGTDDGCLQVVRHDPFWYTSNTVSYTHLTLPTSDLV